MKLINVAKSSSDKVKSVWFDTVTGYLYVAFGSILRAIKLDLIPPDDFDSTADITDFSIGKRGTVVVCHHADGGETWLPVDMWQPKGFTPSRRRARGRKQNLSTLPLFSRSIIEARRSAGLTQLQAAKIADIPWRTLQQWEQGRQEPPQDRLAKSLAIISSTPHELTVRKITKRLAQKGIKTRLAGKVA
jgi:DNA-binding transcriptional regulator YiaG